MQRMANLLRVGVWTVATLAMIGVVGCASKPARYASAPTVASTKGGLERSLFARDPGGQLSEENLQKILAAPLELELPARLGVMPVVRAVDWRGPSPDYSDAPVAASKLAKHLTGTEPFTVVSEMMPIPSGALGMEALREVAARYRLRYVLLYRQEIEKDDRMNGWVVGYATVIGALFLPGRTLRVDGFIEATLFDVKNGTLLYTVRRRVSGERDTNEWYTDEKLVAMRRKAAVVATKALANDFRREIDRYAKAVAFDRKKKGLPADATPRTAGATGPRKAAAKE